MKNQTVSTENIISEFEIKNGFAQKKETNQRVTCFQRIKLIFTSITVEPFLLCYIVPNFISLLAVSKFNMEKACVADLNYTEQVCMNAVSGNDELLDNVTLQALIDSQVLVADMIAWKYPLQSGVPAIMMLFVGAWSDRTGNRKVLMLIPLVGEMISAAGLLLAVYYFTEWPLWATALIEGVPPAFTGGLSIALMAAYSYIADVTTVESRTLRVGILAVIVTLGIPLATALSGVLTEAVGYYGIFGITFALYALGFIHTMLRIKDVRKTDVVKNSLTSEFANFFNLKNVLDTLVLLVMSRGMKLIMIIAVILTHVLTIGPISGEANVLYLLTLKKFNMDAIEFSLFTTYSTLVGIVGTSIAVAVFSKWLKFPDALIGCIAATSKILSSFVYGFSPNKDWFYSGLAFDIFGNAGGTIVRSLGTKIVKPEEVGKMCSLIGVFETLAPAIYTTGYSKLYANTLETFPGAVYVLGAVMTIPSLCIYLFLLLIHLKQKKDTVKYPEKKEMYAQENAMTVL